MAVAGVTANRPRPMVGRTQPTPGVRIRVRDPMHPVVDFPHPTQYRFAAAPETGARGLVHAVLTLAIHDLGSPKRWHVVRARTWIADHDEAAFSFTWCCEMLGYDPEYVRRRLAKV